MRPTGERAGFPVRIAYVVTEFPKATETFIQRELVEYARRGHEVRVYHLTRYRRREVLHEFARPTLAWARGEPYLLGLSVLGALARACLTRPRRFCGLLGGILKGLRTEPVWLLKSLFILPKCLAFAEDAQAWGADHVHAGFATHPATAAWVIRRMTGIPYSVSCHAHDIFLTQAFLDRKLGEASWVRCISQFNRRFLLDRVEGLEAERLVVNHVGLWTDQIEIAPIRTDATFSVLYVGSLEVRKGVDVLLRALSAAAPSLGDWRAVVIGGGPEAARLRALATELGLAELVDFRGPQPLEEVERVRAEADVQVVPSIVGPGGRTEGLPTVIVESLGRCLPIIASNVTGVPELVVDGETGWLVPPEDVDALSDALRQVAADRPAARAMAERGRERVLDEFDLCRNVTEQLELFSRHRAAEASGRP